MHGVLIIVKNKKAPLKGALYILKLKDLIIV